MNYEKEIEDLKTELRKKDELLANLRYRVRDLEYVLKRKSDWQEEDIDGRC